MGPTSRAHRRHRGLLSPPVRPGARRDASYLQGDASARAYARLATRDAHAVLMDQPRQPDGPPIRDGLPYSRIAHLAEDVRPFVAVAGRARATRASACPRSMPPISTAGFSCSRISVTASSAARSRAARPQAELWRAADRCARRRSPDSGARRVIPLPGGSTPYRVPAQDRGALEIETELLPDWYWPAVKGAPAPDDARAEFTPLWDACHSTAFSPCRPQWILRDYHSPNLMWLPERRSAWRASASSISRTR